MRDLKFHFSAPVCWSIAYRWPLRLATKTTPSTTAGVVTIGPAALKAHCTAGVVVGPGPVKTPARETSP
jgi:hypothetical protein